METKELNFKGFKMNGFLGLFVHLIVLPALIFFGFITCVSTAIVSGILCIVWLIMFAGYMQLEPNEARAMVFFGKYKGTFKETGFFWVNPFLDKKKLSLRARNLDGHSEGSLIALVAATESPDIAAVISLAGAGYPIDEIQSL